MISNSQITLTERPKKYLIIWSHYYVFKPLSQLQILRGCSLKKKKKKHSKCNDVITPCAQLPTWLDKIAAQHRPCTTKSGDMNLESKWRQSIWYQGCSIITYLFHLQPIMIPWGKMPEGCVRTDGGCIIKKYVTLPLGVRACAGPVCVCVSLRKAWADWSAGL